MPFQVQPGGGAPKEQVPRAAGRAGQGTSVLRETGGLPQHPGPAPRHQKVPTALTLALRGRRDISTVSPSGQTRQGVNIWAGITSLHVVSAVYHILVTKPSSS